MNKKLTPLIIIPARMAANRLPGKPLADIAGKPMIQHVWERAVAADIASVWVATDHDDIAAVIRNAGGNAMMTRSDHSSGSDRTFEAVENIDPDGTFDLILNLQGDLPEIDNAIPAKLFELSQHSGADLSTLVTPASDEEIAREQIVKAVVSWDDTAGRPGQGFGRALYFSRAAVPTGDAIKYHHIGVYGWRREALARFVALPESPLEKSERLEQLRALEAGMSIAVAEIDHAPGGIDTPTDLRAARARLTR
jgi:3-deoxy-manno-octulosonate cytidylyltransferase (CMP-KDO synthetase)